MLGRYAKNPEYAKRGRGVYPTKEGVIWSAWTEGHAYVDNLPDPTVKLDDHVRQQRRDWNLPEDVTRNFEMKSRTYAAYALEDTKGKHIAVIVFESTQRRPFRVDELREFVRSADGQIIVECVEQWRSREPDLGFAKGKGF